MLVSHCQSKYRWADPGRSLTIVSFPYRRDFAQRRPADVLVHGVLPAGQSCCPPGLFRRSSGDRQRIGAWAFAGQSCWPPNCRATGQRRPAARIGAWAFASRPSCRPRILLRRSGGRPASELVHGLLPAGQSCWPAGLLRRGSGDRRANWCMGFCQQGVAVGPPDCSDGAAATGGRIGAWPFARRAQFGVCAAACGARRRLAKRGAQSPSRNTTRSRELPTTAR